MAISRAEAKRLVMERLRTWINSLPPAERGMPRVVIRNIAFSPLDLLREVQMETDIGVEYLASQVASMGYVIQ